MSYINFVHIFSSPIFCHQNLDQSMCLPQIDKKYKTLQNQKVNFKISKYLVNRIKFKKTLLTIAPGKSTCSNDKSNKN